MSALPRDPECVFCQDNALTVWEQGGLKICGDPAPLAPGHLLVYSADHYPSAADMDIPLSRYLDEVQAALHEVLAKQFGAYAMFEHGRTGHCIRSRPGERMCHHTHIHFIPIDLDLHSEAGFDQYAEVKGWADVIELGAEADGYALVGGLGRPMRFYPISHGLAPHYLRTVIADAVGVPERADWEHFVDTPEATALQAASHRAVLDIVRDLHVKEGSL